MSPPHTSPRVMAPGGCLVCVEANPRLIPGLSERVAPHADQQRLNLIHAAVTNQCGTTDLVTPGRNSWLTHRLAAAGDQVGRAGACDDPQGNSAQEKRRRSSISSQISKEPNAAFLLELPERARQLSVALLSSFTTQWFGWRHGVRVRSHRCERSRQVCKVISRHGPVVAFSRA